MGKNPIFAVIYHRQQHMSDVIKCEENKINLGKHVLSEHFGSIELESDEKKRRS